jgi:hypothetical protein
LSAPRTDDPPEEWILEDDYIICSQVILSALLFSVPWRHFPDVLEYRAVRIGEERRAAAAEAEAEGDLEPPVLLTRKEGESDADFEKRKEEARRARPKVLRSSRATQVPALFSADLEKQRGFPQARGKRS